MKKQNTIVITGSSSGIGYQLALQLANSANNLVLAARNENKLKELKEKCEKKGAEVVVVKTDVSVEKDCERLIDIALSKFNKIDILINNAGISMSKNFEEVENLSLFRKVMDVNYFGVVNCIHYALPSLIKNKGLIVGVSSLQGKTGFPRSTGYSASKHAMQGFLDSLRIEMIVKEVDVLIVSPGAIDTEIHNSKLDEKGKEKLSKKTFKEKGMMSAERCADLIIASIKKRDRELVMTTKGKILPWLKLIFPRKVDKSILKAVEKFYD